MHKDLWISTNKPFFFPSVIFTYCVINVPPSIFFILTHFFNLFQHCLSGWLNTGQSTLHPPGSLDLRSSLKMKSSTGSQNNEVEVKHCWRTTVSQNSNWMAVVLWSHTYQRVVVFFRISLCPKCRVTRSLTRSQICHAWLITTSDTSLPKEN